jgi:hypothetical protein
MKPISCLTVCLRLFTAVALFAGSFGLPAIAADASALSLPAFAGLDARVMLKGLKIGSDDPFHFEFIVDTLDKTLTDERIKQESSRLIRYFLTALAMPEDQMWVNLSPDESDRIMPDELALTDMGEGMLATDYLLKQLAASLTHPATQTGAEYWRRIPNLKSQISDLSKIWIVPSDAEIYADNDKAFVTNVTLKVRDQGANAALIPEIERRVNDGAEFAELRQICNAVMLAAWFKLRVKETVLAQVYADKKKMKGVDTAEPGIREKVYEQYLDVFRKGVYDLLIKEHDPVTDRLVKRRYFSGGCTLSSASAIVARKLLPLAGHENNVSSSFNNGAIVRVKMLPLEKGKVESVSSSLGTDRYGQERLALTTDQQLTLIQYGRLQLLELFRLTQNFGIVKYDDLKAALGIDALLRADKLLKDRKAVAVIVGSVATDLWRKRATDQHLKKHGDIDIVVLSDGLELTDIYEEGYDWLLPVAVMTPAGDPVLKLNVVGGDTFLRACIGHKSLESIEPGLYLPSRQFLIDLTLTVARSELSGDPEEQKLIRRLRAKIERRLGKEPAEIWAQEFITSRGVPQVLFGLDIGEFDRPTINFIESMTGLQPGKVTYGSREYVGLEVPSLKPLYSIDSDSLHSAIAESTEFQVVLKTLSSNQQSRAVIRSGTDGRHRIFDQETGKELAVSFNHAFADDGLYAHLAEQGAEIPPFFGIYGGEIYFKALPKSDLDAVVRGGSGTKIYSRALGAIHAAGVSVGQPDESVLALYPGYICAANLERAFYKRDLDWTDIGSLMEFFRSDFLYMKQFLRKIWATEREELLEAYETLVSQYPLDNQDDADELLDLINREIIDNEWSEQDLAVTARVRDEEMRKYYEQERDASSSSISQADRVFESVGFIEVVEVDGVEAVDLDFVQGAAVRLQIQEYEHFIDELSLLTDVPAAVLKSRMKQIGFDRARLAELVGVDNVPLMIGDYPVYYVPGEFISRKLLIDERIKKRVSGTLLKSLMFSLAGGGERNVWGQSGAMRNIRRRHLKNAGSVYFRIHSKGGQRALVILALESTRKLKKSNDVHQLGTAVFRYCASLNNVHNIDEYPQLLPFRVSLDVQSSVDRLDPLLPAHMRGENTGAEPHALSGIGVPQTKGGLNLNTADMNFTIHESTQPGEASSGVNVFNVRSVEGMTFAILQVEKNPDDESLLAPIS